MSLRAPHPERSADYTADTSPEDRAALRESPGPPAVIDNETPMPTASVRRIVRWTLRELDLERRDMYVKVRKTRKSLHHAGHFYYGPRWLPGFNFLIIARIPLPFEPYAFDAGLRGGPPPTLVLTWEEALVCIVAHEGKHARQIMARPKGAGHIQNRNGKAVHVGPRVFSEVEAEWAEHRLLKLYRERRRQ